MSEYGIVDVWSESKNVFELLRPEWQQYGTCRGEGTDIFFHERYLHAVREAKKLRHLQFGARTFSSLWI